MKYPFIFWVIVCLLTWGGAQTPVYAGSCFSDPVFERNWSAVVTTGARVRDVACMQGSIVKKTLEVGTSVAIIGETDGWYQVRDSTGTEGWVGTWLLSVSQTPWSGAIAEAEGNPPVSPLTEGGNARRRVRRITAESTFGMGRKAPAGTLRIFSTWA